MKLIYITLVIFIIGCGLSLPYTDIPITSQSQGIIRSQTDKTSLTSVVSGAVLYTNLQDNREVKKGDTLLIIDDSELLTQKKSNFHDYSDLMLQTKDLQYLIAGGERITKLKTSLYQKKLQQHKQEVAELSLLCKQLQIEYDRNKSLFEDRVIAENEFFVFKNNLETAQTKLTKLKSTHRANWQIELKAIQEQRDDITVKNEQLRDQQKSFYITAQVMVLL